MKTLVILVAATALLVAAAARADGDPASDILLGQDVFVTYTVPVPQATVRELEALVASAAANGLRMKVALIATRRDLGAVPSLYGKPKQYAKFLGGEIYNIYPGRLVVVMPNGYGFVRGGALVPRDQSALDKLPRPGGGGPALAAGAERAVRRLAAVHGKRIAAVPAKTGGGTRWRDRLELGGIVLSALAIVAIFALPRRRRG